MELEVYSPISAEAEVKAYTLVGDDIYVKRYTNENIPDWYRQLISDIIATDNTITDLDAAVDYLSTLPAGYDQKITELQLADTTINTSLTSLVATTGSHTAAIASLNATKVDATSAAAIAQTTVGSYFASADAGAWFNSKISTYASDIAANAMDISTLSATVDGQTVMIESVESIAVEANTWSANASKLITNPNGQITGWSFGDGSNIQPYFDIYATNFRIVDATNNKVPFSISGSDIYFNGKVSFTNLTDTPSFSKTFRQPSMPTTMTTGDLWYDTGDNNKVYWYDGVTWLLTTQDVATAVNTNTTTINGSKLTTGTVTAAQIASSTITAAQIAASTITGGNIAAGTITAGNIAANTITASQIAANAITASELAAGSVTADKISVSSLAAVSAILGSVSAGSLSASKFQVNGLVAFNSSYPSNTAPMVISQFQAWSGTTNKTLTFYGASYSSGHRADRFVASTTKFMIDFSITTPTAWASSFAYIDVTVSGNGITSQTVRIRSQNPSATISLAASIAQTTSISFSVSFVTSGTVETPTCTLRAFGFNTE